MKKTSLYVTFVFLLVICSFYLIFLPSYYDTSLFDFTLDDAYIIYRYSENLASGAGPVWNLGEDPVEGYTSFLWMLINAGFIKTGIDPELGSKILSIICVCLLIGIFAFYGKKGSHIVRLIAVTAISISPAFLLISIQGLETVFAGLLITVATLFYIKIIREQTNGSIIGYFIFSLLSVLTRPDIMIYFLVLSIALLVYSFQNKQGKLRSRFILWAVCFFIIPGLIYFFWRWGYYGHLLPNTVYIKTTSTTFHRAQVISKEGINMVLNFLSEMAAPYMIIILLALKGSSSDVKTSIRTPYIHVIIGILSFLFAMFFFVPVQGFLYRYQMPFYPVILLLLVSTLSDRKEVFSLKKRTFGSFAVALLLAFLFFYPYHTGEDVNKEIRNRWKYDRVVMGKGLARFQKNNLTMLVTEAGALPYFSNWRTVDYFGLNDEHIAHNGMDMSYLEEVNPDLVVLYEQIAGTGIIISYKTVYDYMNSNDFVLASVVSRTTPFLEISNPFFHFYFVNKRSRKGQELIDFLQNYPEVKRIPLDSIIKIRKDYFLESLLPKE